MLTTLSTSRQNRRGEGFTLVEVLVVVVLIALVSGLGGGMYAGTYKRLQVDKAARDFILAARYARIMAIEQQRPYKIVLDVENNGFYLGTTGWNEAEEQTENTIVSDYYNKPVEFKGAVKFEDIKIGGLVSEDTEDIEDERVIVFEPTGTAEQAVIQIGDGKTHYSITINAATGKAKSYFGGIETVKPESTDLDAE